MHVFFCGETEKYREFVSLLLFFSIILILSISFMNIDPNGIFDCFCLYLRRNPGASGERSGLQMRSRSPSSLVWASSDSSLTGGDNDVHAGLDESVRNDSLPLNKIP